jgi:hypothetical protein
MPAVLVRKRIVATVMTVLVEGGGFAMATADAAVADGDSVRITLLVNRDM